MIKWVALAGAGFAFVLGAYIGWKTTLKVMDSIQERANIKTKEMIKEILK